MLRVTIAPGATLDYTIVSTGTGCVVSGAGYGWQRQADDGTWQMLTPGLPFPAYAVFLAPGATQVKHAQFPADAGPGTYRLIDGVTGTGNETITLYAGPFTVAG